MPMTCGGDGIEQSHMAKSPPKSKSAMDKLVESFSRLRAEAKERMSDEEFRWAEEGFDQIVARVRARRRRLLASIRG